MQNNMSSWLSFNFFFVQTYILFTFITIKEYKQVKTNDFILCLQLYLAQTNTLLTKADVKMYTCN